MRGDPYPACGLALLLVFALRLSAPAADRWSEPFLGVRYLHRTTSSPKHSIHAAIIDLTAPGVRVVATSPEGKRSTVSSFAGRVRAQVAVNGDFFNLDTRVPICYAMGEGTHWPGTGDTGLCGQVAAGGNRVSIVPPAADFGREPWMRDVVSGHPMLLREGAVLDHGEGNSLARSRHPRTAVGLSRDQKTLFLLVVDGRQDHSVGMSAAEEAKVLKELGAWDALNLDGGGSSAMYIAGRGVVNRPSDGQERLDANHLGVYASAARPGTRAGPPDGSSTPGSGASTPSSGNSGSGSSSSAGARSGTSGGGSSTASSGSSASSSGSSGTAGSSSASSSGTGQPGKTSSPGAGSGGSDLLPGMADALALAKKGAAMTAYQTRVLRRANKVAESDIEAIMRAAIAQPWKDPAAGQGTARRGPLSPVQGKISRGFGPSEDILLPPRPSNGVMHPHFHGGVDIAAPEGAQVKAFDLGRVAFVGVSEGAGVHVVLSHPGGVASAYTHLAKGPHTSGLKVGQYVNAGQVIGQVGRTGVASSPHLHFMLSRGWLIDPIKQLRAPAR